MEWRASRFRLPIHYAAKRKDATPVDVVYGGAFWGLTAVDDGNGGGHQVSAAVAARVSGVVEGAAEKVDGVSLEAESDVGIDGGGDADVGVAEKFLDHDQLNPLLQEQGGGRVPEVVETDAAEAALAEEHGEGTGEVGRVVARPCVVVNTYPF